MSSNLGTAEILSQSLNSGKAEVTLVDTKSYHKPPSTLGSPSFYFSNSMTQVRSVVWTDVMEQ